MKFLLSVFILTFISFLASGQGASQQEIKAAVKRLGAESFKERQKASDFLWRQGIAARTALEAAKGSKDPEIRMRVKKVLKKINTGIFPDTPADLAKKLEKYDDLSSEQKTVLLSKMVEMGAPGWNSLHFLVENQITQQRFDLQLFQDLLKNKKFLLELLHKSPRWDILIESLLKAGFFNDNFNDYLSWTVKNGKLEQRIAEFEKLVDGPRGQKYRKMLAYMYRAAGRLKQAREAAERSRMKWLAFRISLEMEDFAYCLEKYPEMTRNKDGIETLGWTATLQRLTGKKDKFEKTVAQILQTPNLDNNNYWLAAEALLVNEQVSKAIELFRKNDPTGMNLAGFQQRTQDFVEANERFIKKQGKAPLSYISYLHFQGERDRANELFQKIADKVLKGEGDSDSLLAVLGVATKIKHPSKDKLIEYALNDKNVEPRKLAARMFPGSSFWWNYIEMKYPQDDVKQQFKHFLVLIETMPKNKGLLHLLNESSQLLELLPKNEQVYYRHTLASFYEQKGEDKKALAEIMKIIKLNDSPSFMLGVGDWHAERNDWAKAAECYGKTSEKYPMDSLALMLWGNALVKIGKEKAGKEKIKIASLMPLGNLRERLHLASALAFRGLNELALNEYELIKAMEFYNSWYLTQTYQRIPALGLQLRGKDIFLPWANYFRLAAFECLSPNISGISPIHFLQINYKYHLFLAKGFMAKKQYQKALKEYQQAFAIADINLDDVIEAVNEFDKLKLNKEAELIYQHEKGCYQKNLQLFPKSGDFCNSLAWLMSRTHRELDEALDLSKEAVKRSPDNAAYLDTLAEVYFHLKNRDKAVELQKKALEHVRNPDRKFMQERLKRFQNKPFPQ